MHTNIKSGIVFILPLHICYWLSDIIFETKILEIYINKILLKSLTDLILYRCIDNCHSTTNIQQPFAVKLSTLLK